MTVLLCLVTGTWVTRVQMARADLMSALAAKERAMEALARTQGELAAAEHAAGAAAERERWAREVHDTLAQGFVSVVALSQAARAELDEPEQEGAPALHERLAQIEEVSRDNLTEARALVTGRGPSALRCGGLDAALRRLARAQGRVHGVDGEFGQRGPAPVDGRFGHARAAGDLVDAQAPEAAGGQERAGLGQDPRVQRGVAGAPAPGAA